MTNHLPNVLGHMIVNENITWTPNSKKSAISSTTHSGSMANKWLGSGAKGTWGCSGFTGSTNLNYIKIISYFLLGKISLSLNVSFHTSSLLVVHMLYNYRLCMLRSSLCQTVRNAMQLFINSYLLLY